MDYGEEALRALAGDEFERLDWVEYRPAAKPPGLYLTREKAGALPLDNPLRGRHPTGDLDAPVLPVPFTAAQFFAFEAMAGPVGLLAKLTDEELQALRTSAPAVYKLVAHEADPGVNGPTHWTIVNAAAAIAAQERWHDGARDTLRKQMMQAARDGALTVRHPHTDLPYRPEVVLGFYELVTPADVNAWLASDRTNSLRWIPDAPEPGTAAVVARARTQAGGGNAALFALARTEAQQAIARYAARDLYPPQAAIADEVAADLRKRGIFGADGKPLTGATIKRHALRGISSATKKAQSTTLKRGK